MSDALAGIIGFTFNSAKRPPISVSQSDGTLISFVAEDSDILGGDYRGKIYVLDWKHYVSLFEQRVSAIRFLGGWGTKEPHFFQLGGSRSSDPFYSPRISNAGEVQIGIRDYALRGYPEGLRTLRGRRAVIGSLEYRFPLYKLDQHAMFPAFGLHQVHGSAFFDVGDAWDEGSVPEETHFGVG